MLENNQKISPWKKPGGTLGKIVAGLGIIGGGYLLIKNLPFLISLAGNLLHLALLVGAIILIIMLVTNKKFQAVFSSIYFMIMRKLTGLVVEIDPIAIVRNHIVDMKRKIAEIQTQMGKMNGLIKQSEKEIDQKKKELENNMHRLQAFQKKNDMASANVAERQAVRLQEAITRRTKRLEESKKWYEILQQLKKAAELTVEDTENEVKEREDEYKSIKAQHKAFKSMMSIINGEPDKMDIFNQAMEYMADDMSSRLGEMSVIIEETGGILTQIQIDDAVASAKAEDMLKAFEQNGIDGLFNSKKKNSQTTNAKQLQAHQNDPLLNNNAVDATFTQVNQNSQTNNNRKYF